MGHKVRDGAWHFPTLTRADFDNAVQALGRTPGRNRTTVRRYLIKRARAEGWPIPSSWQSDGSVKRAALVENDSDDLRFQLECAKFGSSSRPAVALASNDDLAAVRMQLAEIRDRVLEARQLDRLARQFRGATERDRKEDEWLLRAIRNR
ncbi:MAG: hypothetical protein ACXVS6_16875 [Solirubrobacteraceae bacterium]